jgi:hypothetical protein
MTAVLHAEDEPPPPGLPLGVWASFSGRRTTEGRYQRPSVKPSLRGDVQRERTRWTVTLGPAIANVRSVRHGCSDA